MAFFPQARTDDILFQDVEGEMVLYDQVSEEAHLLNPTTKLVWKHCDGETSVPALTALLNQKLEVSVDKILVEAALKELDDVNLLATPLKDGQGVTRRAALRKMGKAGVAAAAFMPVVTSITAPTPQDAASSYGDGNTSPTENSNHASKNGGSTNAGNSHNSSGWWHDFWYSVWDLMDGWN